MKVYVSSTQADLESYRSAVMAAIRGLGHEYVAMEDYHAENAVPIDKCRTDVAGCDIYVGIIAWRYGFVPADYNSSVTELEYRTAVERSIPTLIFLLDEDAPWPPKFVDRGESRKRVESFRDELKQKQLVSFFDNPADLRAKTTQALAKLVAQIQARETEAVREADSARPAAAKPRIYLSRLPITGGARFGRSEQLKQLDEAWANDGINVLSIVAWGGVGKSALINTWLAQMANDNYRGADRAFGWSFYDQESAAQEASADVFIAEALAWCGDHDPTRGSLWEKGQRLGELVRKQRTLLVLDGLEVLQQPPGPDEGRLKDQGMQALLRDLAWQNPGLCIVATRLPVFDLQTFLGNTVAEVNLEHLTADAGAELLESLGVKGTREELMQASQEFRGHALALTLLGGYLAEWHDGQIWRRYDINQEEGDQWRRMIASYERMLGEGPELDLLQMLGLFNGPAHRDALNALREPPEIEGLTGSLLQANWNRAVTKLRKLNLVAGKNPDRPNVLDAHPMVRQHFSQQLKQRNSAGWCEANNRLFEHYRKLPKEEFPDTLDEMAYLFQAVTHGCRAGRYQEAWDDVYWPRIRRADEGYSVLVLGAYGADLVALANFFEEPWDRPISDLDDLAQACLMTETSFDLRGLGRLEEAIAPGRAGLNKHLKQERWSPAGNAAGNLSELLVTFGDLKQATIDAEQSIELASRAMNRHLLITNRATLAAALHQRGEFEPALRHFSEAESLFNELDPSLQYLHALRGYQFCDLLLDLRRYEEVLVRARVTLAVDQQRHIPHGVGLAYLALARAHMLQTESKEIGAASEASRLMTEAIHELKLAGHQDLLILGLLASAELSLALESFDEGESTLEEAYATAVRGQMRLHQADCHLQYAKLYLARRQPELARKSFAEARQGIQSMGYHRRDSELEELEAML